MAAAGFDASVNFRGLHEEGAGGMMITPGDETMIMELASMQQQVPVVGSVQWEKLQSLLRSICSRLNLQASQIEKVAEQGEKMTVLTGELDKLCKDTVKEVHEGKKEETEKVNWSSKIEQQLQGLEAAVRNSIDTVSPLQGIDLSFLEGLPSKLGAMEEALHMKEEAATKGSKGGLGFIQGVDGTIGGIDLTFLQSLPLRLTAIETKVGIEGISDTSPPLLDSNGNPILDADGKPMRYSLGSLHSDISNQSERLNRIDEQMKELKLILLETARAHGSDIDSLQKQCRNLRSDLEMRPIIAMTEQIGNSPGNVIHNPNMDGVLSEIQNRLQRKADNDAVDQLFRNTSTMKEGIERMKSTLDDLKQQFRLSSESSKRGSLSHQNSSSRRNSSSSKSGSDVIDDDMLTVRFKNLETDLVILKAQMASKADRSDLDELQVQAALNQHEDPGSSENTKKMGENIKGEEKQGVSIDEDSEISQQDTDMPREEDEQDYESSSKTKMGKHSNSAIPSTFYKLQALISKKADREELIQIHETINSQRMEMQQIPSIKSAEIQNLQEMYRDIIDDYDEMKRKIKDMEERSDLAVLLSKRLENFVQPPATIQEAPTGLEEIQAAINEHAERMMDYGDMLLQMETLLASKVDADRLQALKDTLMDFNKRRKTKVELVPNKLIKQGSISNQSAPEGNLEKYEQTLSKLTKDVEFLSKSILLLSGYNVPDMDVVGKEDNIVLGNDIKVNNIDINSEEFEDPQRVKVESSSVGLKEEVNTMIEEQHKLSSEIGENPGDLQTNPTSSSNDVREIIEELREALRDQKIKPKGDADLISQILQEMQFNIAALKKLDESLLEKASKGDIQRIKSYIKKRLERAETAMLSGKPLLNFKCMSCDHPLEKLNPNRALFVPTNCMPPQLLPMHSAERLYSHKEEESSEIPLNNPSEKLRAVQDIENMNVSPIPSLPPNGDSIKRNSSPKPRKPKAK